MFSPGATKSYTTPKTRENNFFHSKKNAAKHSEWNEIARSNANHLTRIPVRSNNARQQQQTYESWAASFSKSDQPGNKQSIWILRRTPGVNLTYLLSPSGVTNMLFPSGVFIFVEGRDEYAVRERCTGK